MPVLQRLTGVKGIPRRLRALSEDQQLALAALLGFVATGAMFAAVVAGSTGWVMVQIPLSITISLPTIWLLKPWYDGLPSRSQRRFSSLPLVYYIVLVALFAILAIVTAPADRASAAVMLLLVCGLQFVYGTGIEPTNFPLERLRGRLGRAAPVRVFTIWCGLLGVLWMFQHTRDHTQYQAVLLGATLTLGIAGTAASVKIFARVRRLCTALDTQVQAMIRCLEELRDESGNERKEKRQAARRAWDDLERVLSTRVDTGVRLAGAFVLPGKAIHDLQLTVISVVDALQHDEGRHRVAVDQLSMIRAACRGRIDVLA
jgi:hypothetical protein